MPRKRRNIKPLTVNQILEWADAYHRKHGIWPEMTSGAIDGTTESWSGVNFALYRGSRGLRGKSSLSRLLRSRRSAFRCRELLDEETIFRWAKAEFRRTGRWPGSKDGIIHDAPRETWRAVYDALRGGLRGLRGGLSLLKLYTKH